jgi:predicted regulator of Ras-like GTPase activity (Roadblock/LC7/MglB family)
MPYQSLLDGLVRAVAGARCALLLDGTGEVVIEAGTRGEVPRLIGAYQGIVLSHARRAAERCGSGRLSVVVGRYQGGAVVLRPLKDEYYLVLCLGCEASVPFALQLSAETELRVNAAL